MAMTEIESLERVVNWYVCRWIGVPTSFTLIGLYSKTAQLQLPPSSIIEKFKVTKCRLVIRMSETQEIRQGRTANNL